MSHPPDRISGGSFLSRLGIDAEPAIKGGANIFGVEKCSASDFVKGEKSFRLPLPEGSESGTGGFAWEYNLDAVFCADELLICGHGREDGAPSRPFI